jgi:hypothetical protein
MPDQPTRYRKRPVVIEAIQFGNAEWADKPSWRARSLPSWLIEAQESDALTYRFESEDYWYFFVRTLEGEMRGGPDDWLIRGVQGELYPCKPDIFAATYEAVDDD